ncbi:hypothetical protein D9M68_541360 [compost metagenome]
MARFPHERHAAGRFDRQADVAAALHVVDDGGARIAFQHVAGEQHQLAVRPDDLAGLRDHAQAVAVAVERQAQFAVGLGHALDQVLQVLGFGGVRVVVGEGAVHVAEQLSNLAAQGAEQRGRHGAGHAVAAVDSDLHGPRQLDARGHARDVGGHQVQLAARAGARRGGRGRAVHGGGQRLHVIAVEGAPTHHHLEAVVLGRIVAAGDRHARARLHDVGGEVDQGRGHHPDVQGIHAAFQHAFLQRHGQHFAAQAAVAADDQRLHALFARAGGQRRAQRAREAGVDQVRHGAADVIGLEDCGGKLRVVAHGDSFGKGLQRGCPPGLMVNPYVNARLAKGQGGIILHWRSPFIRRMA